MKIRVGVFFGGESCEHEISCITGNQALHAIDADKYEVLPVYVAKNLDLYTGEALYDLSNYWSLEELVGKLDKITLVKDGNKVYVKKVHPKLFEAKPLTIDVAFLAMHGTNGEDGTLQGYMEMLKLPYTSSNVLGSAVGQDKAIMKTILAYNKIPMTDWFSFYGSEFEEDEETYIKKAAKVGYPLIIKPANLGSSIGIEVARDESEFVAKVRSALEYDLKVVVEHKIENLKEVNCSVLGTIEEPLTSPIEEVYKKKDEDILDFAGKYNPGNAKGGAKGTKGAKCPAKGGAKGSGGMANASRKVPADISEKMQKKVEDLSVKTFRTLNAYGCVRIDYLIDLDTDKVYVNEINSIPGSLAFYLWQEDGMGFDVLCDHLIKNAIKRYRQKEKLTLSFDTNILSNFRRNN